MWFRFASGNDGDCHAALLTAFPNNYLAVLLASCTTLYVSMWIENCVLAGWACLHAIAGTLGQCHEG